jgi:hypothetical protein
MSPTTFQASLGRSITADAFTQRSAISVRPNSRTNTPRKRSNQRPNPARPDGPTPAELKALPPRAPISDLAPLLADFADTAAAISQLDLVLMTDIAVAHLAGALGKPVWVLLNHVAHWLWLLERIDSPWYPSLRLFRPQAWGDWTDVFDQAAAELIRLTNARRVEGKR